MGDQDKKKEACEHADAIISDLESNRKREMQPDITTYNKALGVYAASGDGEKADKLLYAVCDKFEDTGDDKIKPNIHTFNAAIRAWSCQSSNNDINDASSKAPERAQ